MSGQIPPIGTTVPDLILDQMSVFDWFKPLDKAIDVVDELVEDKDLRNELKAELQHAEIDLRKLAQETYITELKTETIPWVDALHKMGRQIISVLSMIVGASILIYAVSEGQELDLETMLAVLALNSPAGIYNFVKGKGNAE